MTGAGYSAHRYRNGKDGGLRIGASHTLMKQARFNGHINGKIGQVMHEYKHGMLHSGSSQGPVVASRKQAIAIALSEANMAAKKKRKKGR